MARGSLWTRRAFATGLGVTAVGAALGPAAATASESPKVVVKLSSSRADVGHPVQLSIEVSRADGGDMPEPAMPEALAAESFEVEGPSFGRRSHMTFVNGRSTSQATHTYTYLIIPRRPGRFELSTHVVDGGNRIASNVAVLDVGGRADDGSHDPETGTPTEPDDAIFLWSSVDKPRAYVGQQITYRLDTYLRVNADATLRRLPSFEDFWTIELPEGVISRDVVGGVPYRVRPELRRALFPQRAGTLRIGSCDARVQLPWLSLSPRLSPMPGTDLPAFISAQAIDVEVAPLPAEGRPPGFSPNNVGQYTIVAEVDREDIEHGKPFTLTVTIEGTGNLSFLDPGPWPEIDGARRYDPKEDTELVPGDVVRGKRRYRFPVIPERAGRLVIPSHALSFFDPDVERYATVRSDPIVLDVARSGDGTTGPATGPGATTDQPGPAHDDELAPIFVSDSLPRHVPRTPWLNPERWWAAMLGAPATLGFVGSAGLLWRRLGPGEKGRARARARARRREQLAAARAALDSGDGFHAALGQLLQDLAQSRAGPDGAGLPRPELLALLRERGVESTDLDRWRELADRCDEARFGAQLGSREERDDLLRAVDRLARASSLASPGRHRP